MVMKHLMIVDCDCGVDDALALLLALAYKDTWQLLAVTCCYGNTTLDNVCNNVRKVLQFCNEFEVPVYRGCDRPLIKEKSDTSVVHGGDGFGNVGHEYPHDQLKIADGHAANALVHLAKTHRQDVHLVVLGPMTNVALAHRLDPEFTANLKSIHFMGGNIHGVGNTTAAAEFNFLCDPEAANIVVTESKCPVTMVPWETTANHGMSWEAYEAMINIDTLRAKFVKNVSRGLADLCKSEEMTFVCCDLMAVATLVCSKCVKAVKKYPVSVETVGIMTTGQAVVDRRISSVKEKVKLIIIITEFDDMILQKLHDVAVLKSIKDL